MNYDSEQNQRFSSVTQCPFCETAFHIGLAQLDAAEGRVRCGACLQIFNAKAHFLVEQRHLFDDELGEAQQQDSSTEEEETDPLSVDLFGALIPDDHEPVILGDINHHSGKTIPRDAILKDRVDRFQPENYEHASAEKVLGDIRLTVGDEESVDDATPAYAPTFAQNLDEKQADQSKPNDKLAEQQASANRSDIQSKTSVSNRKKIGYFHWLAALIVMVAFPLQVLFLQPDILVEKSWFRKISTQFCPILQCTIREYSNINAIKISGFIVPHSEYTNSLVANIELLNSAVAEQPFPNIEILFRNNSGRITASRKFQPDQYLQTSALNMTAMPINQRIQIELDLIDPGEQFSNYELFISD